MERTRQVSKGNNCKFLALSFATIIPLFRPRSITQFGVIGQRFFYIVQVIFAFVLICFFFTQFINKRKRAISPVAWMVIVYKAWESFAIFRNGLGDISTIIYALGMIGATVFTEYLLRKAPIEYLLVLSLYTGVLVLINNISSLFGGFSGFTDATGNVVYFWQTKNHLSSLFFIAMISSYLYYGTRRSNFANVWNLFVLLNVVWGTITFESATTVVGIITFLIMFYLFKKKTDIYRPVLFYFLCFALHIAIVIFRVQDIFAYFIEQLLHRSLSMSGRTIIWDRALLSLLNKPIIGYGQSSIFTFSFARTEIPAHNQFLDIGIVCGIPGMIIYLIIFFLAFLKLKQYSKSVVARVICCTLLAYMVMSITESPTPYQPWFILLGIISLIPEIDRRYIYIKHKLTRNGILKRKRVNGNMI